MSRQSWIDALKVDPLPKPATYIRPDIRRIKLDERGNLYIDNDPTPPSLRGDNCNVPKDNRPEWWQKQCELTLKEISFKCGIGIRQVSRILTLSSPPSVPVLARMQIHIPKVATNIGRYWRDQEKVKAKERDKEMLGLGSTTR